MHPLDKFIVSGETLIIQDSTARNAAGEALEKIDDLAEVATTGDYNDLINKPVIPEGVIVDSELSNTSINPVQNKIITGALNEKINSSDLAIVATSGEYSDLNNKPDLFDGNYNSLTNKPTIPSKTSQLTNDSGFTTFDGNYNSLTNKPTIPSKTSQLTNDSEFINKLTSVTSNPYIRFAIPHTTGTAYQTVGTYTGTFSINQAHGSGYLTTFSITLPSSVAMPNGVYACELTIRGNSQVISINMGSVTKNVISGWLWSPFSSTNQSLNIHVNMFGY